MNDEIETNNNMQQLNNLYTFLDKYRIVKTDNNKTIKASHLSMDTFLGSFNIPDDKSNHFMKHYQKAIKAGHIPSILESHLEQGPIIIDLDFKYILKSTANTTRVYTDLDIKVIIEIYNKIILSYLAINEEDLNIYILPLSLT